MPASPTARTLAECRRRGWIPDVVERHNTFSGKKLDLYGCIDVVVMDDHPGLLGIQATSGTNSSARIKKIRTERADMARAWLERGNRLQVWGWRKFVKPIKGRYWWPKITEIALGDLDGGNNDGETKAGD